MGVSNPHVSVITLDLRILSLPTFACVYVCVSVYVSVRVCVRVNPELVRVITHHPFKLGSPYLDQRCTLVQAPTVLFVSFRYVLFMFVVFCSFLFGVRSVDLGLQGKISQIWTRDANTLMKIANAFTSSFMVKFNLKVLISWILVFCTRVNTTTRVNTEYPWASST